MKKRALRDMGLVRKMIAKNSKQTNKTTQARLGAHSLCTWSAAQYNQTCPKKKKEMREKERDGGREDLGLRMSEGSVG